MTTIAADLFEYLEDGADPRTQAWTCEQNARSRAVLDAVPGRAALRERFDELLEVGYVDTPVERGGRHFYAARHGRQDQPRLYVRDNGTDRVLLDPAQLDPSGLTALDWWYASPHGTYVAYGLSTNGDERSVLHLLDVARGAAFGETIPNTRYASLAWLPDERAFFYTRVPPGGTYSRRVYFHALGARWEDDPLVFGEERAPEDHFLLTASEDGRRLLVSVLVGWSRNDLFLADLTAAAPFDFKPLVVGREALYDAHFRGEHLVVRTNDGAPRYRLLELDPNLASVEDARELVAEDPGATLERVAVARGGLVLSYLRDASSQLEVLLDGGTRVALPGFPAEGSAEPSTVLWLESRESSADVFASVSSFLRPRRVVRLRLSGHEVDAQTWADVASPVDPQAYRVEQHWFSSKDGTRVPMFVLARRTTRFDGSAPAVLYGYGGFNVGTTPQFWISAFPWLDAGGVFAVVNLRGGGEFGESWHRAGMRESKQNVFDDFIGAVEYVRDARIADGGRIGIAGGSNGGLLVAAVETQRPDLLAAVYCSVPLTDMLRFHRFLLGKLWVDEFGDPDDPAAADYLSAYSPYHNVRDGVAYPPTSLVTAESDSRVDPMHARKFGARLQQATSGTGPVLVFVEERAGHGAGKPRTKQLEEFVDRWSFLGAYLGISWVKAA